ncbi:MAG: DUF6580 family putative transport protein [Candidatus Kryptoniota bacterium]
MNTLFALILVLVAAFSRLIPHAPNFTPAITIALFAGTYFPRRLALLVPIAAILASDIVIGFYAATSMLFVYGSYALIAFLGILMKTRISAIMIAGYSLLSAVLFFVLTNFGVWLTPGAMYPRTLSGLLECYIMALPFFRNTVASTAIFSAVMFGAYEAAEKFFFKTRTA